ncbi:hypothetical protein M4D54_00915 [Brachybacterium sp. p3-SID1565]|uniref:hypothetical protein n=1 Tax=Brachybacterium sp. p3-SID1565 TaxID=2916046 RepID=UPI0021A7283B|nr:hypothetical protein [Brachybacterium sp. p3-SID1565]MCT1384204.1 hypothetical protein [Brachybacterium sp. p3-SID1565]
MALISGCTPGPGEAVPLGKARNEVAALVEELQEAFTLREEAEWSGPDREALAPGEDGSCRWRPGTWSTPLRLEESDPSWPDRRERVNEVLAEHGLGEVGDPEYTGGAAYGFETGGPAGGRLRIDSWKGESTIYLHGLAVEVEGACDGSALTG